MWFQPKKMLTARYIISFVFGLGLLGLVFSFGDLSIGYEVPKTIWLKWWVRLLVVGMWWLVLRSKGKFKLKSLSKSSWFNLGQLIIVIAIAAGLGVNWQQSLWGNYFRGDGLVTWWHLIVLGLLTRWLMKEEEVKKAMSFGGVVSWILIIMSSWWPLLANWSQIGFGNSNITGGFIVITTPLVVSAMKKLHWRSGLVAFVISMMTTIYIEAWGAVVSLVIGIVMWWVIRNEKLRKWVILIPALSLALGVVGLMWWQPAGNSKFTESRVRVFHKLGRAVVERPFLGWGWANVDSAFNSVDWPVPTSDDVYVDKAHSQLLETAVTSGLLGLAVYLIFIGHVYYQVVRSSKLNKNWIQVLFITFLLYFFHSQTNVTSVAEEAMFWIVTGLLLDA